MLSNRYEKDRKAVLPNRTNRRRRHILLLLRINGAQLIRLESLTVIPLPMIEYDEHIYGQENVLKHRTLRFLFGNNFLYSISHSVALFQLANRNVQNPLSPLSHSHP